MKSHLNDELFDQFIHISKKLEFIKIIVLQKDQSLKLYYKADDFLTLQNIDDLKLCFKEYFPEIKKLDINIAFKKSMDDFNTILSLNKDYIIQTIVRLFPATKPWFDTSIWHYDLKGITIVFCDPYGIEFLKNKKCDVIIESLFSEYFNINIKVHMSSSQDDHNEFNDYIIEKRNEEKEIIKNFLTPDKKKVRSSAFNKNESIVLPKNHEKKSLIGKIIHETPVKIQSLCDDSGKVVIQGDITDIEIKELKSGKTLCSFDITDYSGSITFKVFADKEIAETLHENINIGDFLTIRGDCQYDKFQKEISILAKDISRTYKETRIDEEKDKRVEFHLHTQLSAMDGLTSVSALIEKAAQWQHTAIAITDHGVVQAFPDAYILGKKKGIKIIYGVEAYVTNDSMLIIQDAHHESLQDTFVIFDIETTGLNAIHDQITEIGAVKIKNQKIISEFHSLVNPNIDIPTKITSLTGITNEMVKDAPSIKKVLQDFYDYSEDSILVAHNASFDTGFIRAKAKQFDLYFRQPVLDTLLLCRELYKNLKHYKLNLVAKHLGITVEQSHRALSDAKTTCSILLKSLSLLEQQGVENLEDINTHFIQNKNFNSMESFHTIILAQNMQGLTNLYKLISISHLEYFFRKPRIPKSVLVKYRQGLIIGSACEAGELFQCILNGSDENEIEKIVNFYDYLEIQPLENNSFLIRENKVKNLDDIKVINETIVKLGDKFNKLVIATGDVHFLEPRDEYFRRILMHGQGFSDADQQAPLYFKTTREMLNEFNYLGEQKANEVVIQNTQAIADSIMEMKPFPDELHTPEIEGAEDEIRNMAQNKAHMIYGTPLPEIVENRLEKELNSIINNGFAVLYLIAHKLVKKSLHDGYLVGSRGSVGSSFVATMTEITEVNPLPPHYICTNCKYSDFNIDIAKIACGVDLPDRTCPECGTFLGKDGYDIPFEVFLGFEGDKVPDIDLNFSGDYQPIAHKYTEELFGEGHVFRAGTISTIAEKTAFGFVKNYLLEKNIITSNAEIKRLVKGCTGVKKTSGQHPGGVIVVPKHNNIYQFTPIQHPADDKSSGVITTHFDFNSLHDRLVKLDILGHDDPTVIKMLEDLTGLNARSILIGDKDTMKIFSSTEPLHIKPDDINSPVGTFGIPEFGTRFVRQMLADTKPTTMSELIRISGLSHGTDVWLNNAKDLIRNGTAKLSEVICTRDDIMIYLIYKGMEPTIAFKIMENVRKGKGLTLEFIEKMQETDIPEWFINSCLKIKYMFPKAHAAAYVMMAFRIAYYKVHYPKAFYAAYFSVRADDFDANLMLNGVNQIESNMIEIESKGNNATVKEKNVLTILEITLEMYKRKIFFTPIDLYLSDAVKFDITESGIRPPLISLPGLGLNAARNIVETRKQGQFISIEDFQQKSKISKTVIDILRNHGCLSGIPETSQISLF